MNSEKFDMVVLAGRLVTPTSSGHWFDEENVQIAITDGQIKSLAGGGSKRGKKLLARKYLDLSDELVTPGFVNGHTHLAMTLFRGLAEDMEFQQWLNDYILPIEKNLLDRDFVRVGTELAAWECIDQGVTCVNDMYYFTDTVMEVLDKSGLRGIVAQTFMSYPTPDNPSQNGSDLKLLQKNIKRFESHPRLKPAAGPHAPYTCDDLLLQSVRNFANANSLLLHIHVSETDFEVKESLKNFGLTPVKRLEQLGIMDGATCFAHGIHLTADDIEAIASKNCGVIHNPESNMKIRAGVCNVPGLLERGVSLGLGTDGAASNNNLNMLCEMDVGIKLQKLQGNSTVTAKDFFRMATLGSAEAIGMGHEVGSIEVGKRADLISFSLKKPNMIPMHDPISQIVYSATGSEITHVLCEGKPLMLAGKIKTLDTKKIQADVTRYQKKITSFLKKQKRS